LYSKIFGDYARDIITWAKNESNVDLDLKIHPESFIREKKMGLFLSVTEGSDQEPVFLEISYLGKGNNDIDLALVGKGVTFDSGGISLKPPSSMYDMKGDMGGAAVSLLSIVAATLFKIPINLKAVIPLCENMPSGKASKPGDVRVSLSGKSVEILNTDAEGRLIMADAITYVKSFNPKRIIDIATLTGAIIIALGHEYTGVFSNCGVFWELIKEASKKANDKAWRMPLDEQFRKDLDSKVSDFANINTKRTAGSSSAAMFLKEFIGETTWAHLDIAGSTLEASTKDVFSASTGKPLQLMIELLNSLSKSNDN